jgi:hypothetical protein
LWIPITGSTLGNIDTQTRKKCPRLCREYPHC